MSLGTVIVIIVLIAAVLMAAGVIPHSAVVVGLLITGLCVALLVGGVRL